jgi:hypothetical protein
MAVHTLSVRETLNTIGGHKLAGFGDDSISIEYQEDTVEVVRGVDGEVTRVIHAVDDVQITITLKQSSSSNDFLSALWNADKLSGGGILPWATVDGSGTTLVAASECFVKKPPVIAYGKSAKDRVWIMHTGPAVVTIGGN